MATKVFDPGAPGVKEWVGGTSEDQTQNHVIRYFFSSPSSFGRTSQMVVATQFFCVTAFVACILRVFLRRHTKTPLGWDDTLALVATIILMVNQQVAMRILRIGSTVFSFIQKNTPAEEEARLAGIVYALKLILVFEVLYLTSIFCVKVSMLFLYRRFARQTRGITLYLHITFGICAAAFGACLLSLFLPCIPVSQFWALVVQNEKCMGRGPLVYTSGVSNIVTNTLVLAVPVPLVLRAALTCRQKTGLAVLYFFGAFVIIAAVLRFVTQLLGVYVVHANAWSQFEVSLGVILASAPMAVNILLMPLEDPKAVRAAIEAARRSPPDASAAVLARLRAKEAPYRGDLERGAEKEKEGQQQPPPVEDCRRTKKKLVSFAMDTRLSHEKPEEGEGHEQWVRRSFASQHSIVSECSQETDESSIHSSSKHSCCRKSNSSSECSCCRSERSNCCWSAQGSSGSGRSSTRTAPDETDYYNLQVSVNRGVDGKAVWEVKPID